jgi:hypothetical protein
MYQVPLVFTVALQGLGLFQACGTRKGECAPSGCAPCQNGCEATGECVDGEWMCSCGCEAGCPAEPPGHGEVRARVLACDADLPTGRFAVARTGDIVLENSLSRFVIRTGSEGEAIYGLVGGGLVDAVLMEDGEQVGADPLREVAITSAFWLIEPEAVEVVADGSDGEARVQVRGGWKSLATIHEILPSPRPSDELVHEWVLRPDAPVLDLVTRDPEGGDVAVIDLQFWSGEVRPWIPGHGAFGLPSFGGAELLAFESLGTVPAAAFGATEPFFLVHYGPLLGLSHSGSGQVVRSFSLGSDLASAMAPHWQTQALETTMDTVPPGARYEVRDEDGAPLTRCTPDGTGAVSCDVPPGAGEAVWVGDGTGDWGGSDQQGQPAIVHVTADGAYRLTGLRSDGLRRVLAGAGESRFLLPPGEWELSVTRGLDWPVVQSSAVLEGGDEIQVAAPLAPVVVHGWLAADLHLHTEWSADSQVRTHSRLVGAAAEGLDLVVLTEHDAVHPADDSPSDLLMVVSGVEISTMGLGHFNAWPMVHEPDLAGGGAIAWHGADLQTLYGLVPEDALLQCNHPRFVDGGYAALFDTLDLDEDTPLEQVQCDAVEVINGFASENTEAVLADWMLLLDRGLRITATGTSDSHVADDYPGHPRTLLQVEGEFTAEAAWRALREGRAIATAGPFLGVVLTGSDGSSADIGDTLSTAGDIVATAVLAAPEWMELGTVDLYANGEIFATFDASEIEAVGGLSEQHWSANVPTDARWVVAFHHGASEVSPGARHSPLAVTNPIWVER